MLSPISSGIKIPMCLHVLAIAYTDIPICTKSLLQYVTIIFWMVIRKRISLLRSSLSELWPSRPSLQVKHSEPMDETSHFRQMVESFWIFEVVPFSWC